MKRVFLFLFVVLALTTVQGFGQCLSSWNYINTGSNQSVLFYSSGTYLNGTAVTAITPSATYYLGFFYTDPATSTLACGGYIELDLVNDANVAAAWGDDSTTPGAQGFATNEAFTLKLMKIVPPSSCEIYDLCSIGGVVLDPFSPNGIQFISNGMTMITSLNFCSSSDVGVQQLIAPVSSCVLGANSQVTVRIKNFGPYPVSNIPVHYSVNGGANVNATYAGPIPGNGTYDYTFTTTADLSALGTFTISAGASLAGDVNNANNSITTTVQHMTLTGVSFSGLASVYCKYDAMEPVTLTGSPIGGSFSGLTFLTDTTTVAVFDISSTPSDSYTITYTYSNATSGCTGVASSVTQIANPPVAAIPDLGSPFCQDPNDCVPLVGTPPGGTWSGVGVQNIGFYCFNLSNPIVNNPLTYIYIDPVSGCGDTAVTNVTVNLPPVATILGGTIPPKCLNSAPITLVGSPAGGVFQGPGINSAGVFNPSAAGVGTHCITYTYTNVLTGCSHTSACKYITVNSIPTVDFSGLLSQYCINASSSNLVGSPSGGFWTGEGIDGSVFNPGQVSNPGTWTINYNYTDANGCSNMKQRTTTVNDLPDVSFTGLLSHYCIGSDTISALTGNPPGLSFSGVGVTGNTFNADVAGIGPHSVTFYYQNPLTLCSNTVTQTTTVHSLPVVSISNISSSYCKNGPVVTLIGSPVPSAGTYSGIGVSNNSFSPTVPAVGLTTIQYTYCDPYGCCNDTTYQVTINPFTTPTLTGLTQNGNYCVQDLVQLTGTPSGGTFNGSPYFTSNNQFNPLTPGTFNLNYSYTNVFGCVGTSNTFTVTVNANPTVDITNLNRAQCANTTSVALTGSPAGGTWGGPGVTGSTFSPLAVGPGIYPVTYTYMSANGCDNIKTKNIKVFALPNVNLNGLNSFYCQGGSPVTLTGTPTGGTFGPTNSNIFTPTTAGQNVLSYAYRATYTYFTDTAKCLNTDFDTTFVQASPPVSLGPDLETAQPDTVVLNAGTFTTYLWSNGNISPTINVPAYGHYAVTVTDGFGCYGIDTILVGGTDVKLLELVSPKDSCDLLPNQRVVLRFVNSGTFTFPLGAKFFMEYKLGSANKNEPKVLEAPFHPGDTLEHKFAGQASTLSQIANEGDYLFRCAITYSPTTGLLPDVNHANDSLYVTVTNGGLPNAIGSNYTSDDPDTLSLTPGSFASYLWNTGELTEVIHPPYGGLYSVTVTDIFGCQDVANFNVISGVDEISQSIGQIGIFPNPNNGSFEIRIDFNEPSETSYVILGLQGQKVLSRDIPKTPQYSELIDLSHLPAGVYLFKVTSGQKVNTRRITIQ